MKELKHILFKRLEKKGLTPEAIPGFIRNLAYAVSSYPHMNLFEINLKLHWLGWDDVDLDEYTLQLIVANSETSDLGGSKPIVHYW
jgi:hypothetical protein